MLRSILIGLDGSHDGEAAVDLGLSWARAHDALAVGVSIVDETGILASEQAMFAAGHHAAFDEPLVELARHRSLEILEQFKRRCHELQVHCKALSESGMPYVRLVEEAQRCDLVVLGQRTHFEYGWQEQADETLARVLKDSPRPVVVVPRSPISGEVAVVAYDGSLQASRALYAFEASGLARFRSVDVVSVDPIRGVAARHANRAVEFLRNHDIEAGDHVVETHDKPGEVILQEVRRRDTGLLVMGAYGKSTLREFLIGSVTRSILEKSPVVVFCYH
jgi:nucleotide-binding universal stress UspA family protein